MGRVLKAVVVLFGTVIGIGTASVASAQSCTQGQDPNVFVCVSGAPSVAYSQAGAPTYWTITVEVQNKATNTLNRVSFEGGLSTDATDSTTVRFVDPATGQYSANPVYLINGTVTCQLGTTENPSSQTYITCGGLNTSIPAGQSLTFNLMSTTPFDPATIWLGWEARFAEGNSTSGGAENGAAQVIGTLSTSVVPPSGNSATASFPAVGGTLATAPDTFTTKIKIPSTANSTSATITETISLDARCKNFRPCNSSDISIPGLVTTRIDPFTIDLFAAASNIRNGVKIENVSIYYTYLDTAGNPVEVAVGPCEIGGQANGDGIPCLDQSVNYKNSKSVPTWTTPTGFGFYWRFLNTKNGSFNLW